MKSSCFHVADEAINESRAFAMMRLQKEVAAFENVNFERVEDAAIRHDLVQPKESVVPPPKQEARRLVFAVVGLNGRKTSDVRAIVRKDLEMNVRVSRSRHSVPIEMPGLRRVNLELPLGAKP